ncbi:LysR family transcriptional regulator [Aestuariicella hydrocarbonica]|uniref:LysR family transcriptional regulator n=1 Tax=Pseudomaricurvus hydrocarbonicus TaxID=1470433 RepID=A0A9E5JTR9_9GAMM|nr:LysR family transcriptional regulator [Aestuariicella hydrocarbonica]NHO65428.1 LysR family transcriptional regulator [Aestuariicella hydrocarbonica]
MSLQSFDLNLLKTFDSLMETRSVSLTAQQLSLTQPAVSNALARLRRLLDDPLLVRTRQGMEPTERALSLKAPIKEGLRKLEGALLPTNAFDPSQIRRRFTLAAPDFIGVELLSRLLPRWKKIAPSISIAVHHLGPETPEKGLEQGSVDLAVGRFLDVPSRFNRQSLRTDKLVCLVARDHPCPKQSLSLKDFLALQFVWVSNSGRRGMVDHWLDQKNVQRDISVVVSTYTSGAMLVAESQYAMVIAGSYADYFSERLPVKALPMNFDPGQFTIDMLWHPFSDGDTAQRWLRNEILLVSDHKLKS